MSHFRKHPRPSVTAPSRHDVLCALLHSRGLTLLEIRELLDIREGEARYRATLEAFPGPAPGPLRTSIRERLRFR